MASRLGEEGRAIVAWLRAHGDESYDIARRSGKSRDGRNTWVKSGDTWHRMADRLEAGEHLATQAGGVDDGST